MNLLSDPQGREFHYLRLSVTDVCNFRCVYCLPQGYQKCPGADAPLSVSEIKNLVAGFASLNFWKVRLTGGEPTTRLDILEVAETVASVPGITRTALSTNGYRLKALAPLLRLAGVQALNVSVDSLDRERFRQITGQDRLHEILAGIDRALESGFPSVKINAVLLRSTSQREIQMFTEFVRSRPISVRFIELMETGGSRQLFREEHLSAGRMQLELLRGGWKILPRARDGGPAVEFEHPGFQGRIGIIAPYSKDFCSSCNRLRVSSRGGLKLCLFGDRDFSLRHLLQSPEQSEELVAMIRSAINRKAPSHYLHEGNYGNTANFASIGG